MTFIIVWHTNFFFFNTVCLIIPVILCVPYDTGLLQVLSISPIWILLCLLFFSFELSVFLLTLIFASHLILILDRVSMYMCVATWSFGLHDTTESGRVSQERKLAYFSRWVSSSQSVIGFPLFFAFPLQENLLSILLLLYTIYICTFSIYDMKITFTISLSIFVIILKKLKICRLLLLTIHSLCFHSSDRGGILVFWFCNSHRRPASIHNKADSEEKLYNPNFSYFFIYVISTSLFKRCSFIIFCFCII